MLPQPSSSMSSINVMATEKLISFDLKGDFGFFKKPDYNDGLLLSYNILHKPALLGILGAVIGLQGYQQKGKLPDYYQVLKDLPIGIAPLEHQKGNFTKTPVKYTNTVGYANLDGTLLIEETMLIKPSYRCYLLLNMKNGYHKKIYKYLKEGEAAFIPYLGKNEYPAWFGDTIQEYQFKPFTTSKEFFIHSIFLKQGGLRQQKAANDYSFNFKSMTASDSFCYFERLPTGFDEVLMQYTLHEFVYTNWRLQARSHLSNLIQARGIGTEQLIIQLF